MKNSKGNIKSLFIPMGMLFGCNIGIILSMFFKPDFLVYFISLGAGLGLLFGVTALAISSKKENE
ncbi:hypothetical protein [Virgibacillus sp. LDC-1]|uniref:hypothetical protein n=1 Tax=Virgibacillus sp. LDC-1 TaxID=3039856 RepID=UPI0024DEC128|nr:hypothetical protein [Virgibacillus sp. LDC-1]